MRLVTLIDKRTNDNCMEAHDTRYQQLSRQRMRDSGKSAQKVTIEYWENDTRYKLLVRKTISKSVLDNNDNYKPLEKIVRKIATC